MTVSVRNHLIRRIAAGALAVAALGLTAPIAAAESFSSAEGSAPDAVSAPAAKRSAPAPAPKPADNKPAVERSHTVTGD